MITQDYINGYISALNNVINTLKYQLLQIRVDKNEGMSTRSGYRMQRKQVVTSLKSVRNIKLEYKKLVNKINKLNNY